MAAAFRKCCGQPIETIIDEYVEFAGDKARVLDIAFIKAFDEREFLCSFRRDTLMDAMPLTGTFAETEPVIDPLSSSVVVSKVV